ncbi:unnamed protein product, partial [Ixodes pacificus]
MQWQKQRCPPFSREARLTSTSCSNRMPALAATTDFREPLAVPITYCGFSLKRTLRISS